MEPISRRSFLTILGGALVLVVDFLYPGVLQAIGTHPPRRTALRPTVDQVVGPDPGFASGRVVDRTETGVILESGAGVRAVRFQPDTVVWKEVFRNHQVVQIGDWLDVRGTPLPDGSLRARSQWVWVNIGRRDGVIEHVGSDHLNLMTRRGPVKVELSPVLEVVGEGDIPLQGGRTALVPGMTVGTVGLRLPDGGFRVTKLWVKR